MSAEELSRTGLIAPDSKSATAEAGMGITLWLLREPEREEGPDEGLRTASHSFSIAGTHITLVLALG